MKKTILTTVLVFICLTIYSITIEEIKSITGGTMINEHNRFVNSILRFQDRLFVHTSFAINEFKIMHDGSLEKISFFETKISNNSYIDENRLYCIVDDIINFKSKIFVFDLSISPMKNIAVIDTGISTAWIISVLFSDNHIMISDIENERMILFNKSTFDVDGYIDGIKSYSMQFMAKSDTLLILRDAEIVKNQLNTTLTFYHLINEATLEREEISSILLTGIEIKQTPKVIENKVVFAACEGVIILDIDDIANPSIEHFVPWDNSLGDVLIYENLLFLSYLTGRLTVYQLDDEGGNRMIYEDPENYGFLGIFDRSMYIAYPYLYMNCSYTLKVYDISDNFNIVFTYGKSDYSHAWHARQNDVYILDIDIPLALSSDFMINKYDIYSASKDMFVCTLYFDKPYALEFELVEDKLYVLGINNYYTFFNIYQISNQEPELLYGDILSISNVENFLVIGNMIYFRSGSPLQTHVYSFDEYLFEYKGSFLGIIQTHSAGYTGDLLLNIHDNNVNFRDINDFQNILMTRTFQYSSIYNVIAHLRDGYLAIYNYIDGRCVFYSYNIEMETLNQIHIIRTNTFNIYNGIITLNATHSYMSEYFTIINGQFQKIGEKPDFRSVRNTAFFPEKNIMVQRAYSGIWLYDIDYKVSEGEKVVLQPDSTRLLGNYPNPFNPETTISLTVGDISVSFGTNDGTKGTHIRIDIFNIRGQRIKTLVNGLLPSGNHVVVWNGNDENGYSVSSGIYFYRLQTKDFEQTRRMLLLK